MAPSRERQAIGQLLVRLLREFRDDLAEPRTAAGFADIREPHLQIFGNIRTGGIRLTEILGEWRKRRAAGAVANAPNPATQPAAPPLGAVKPKSRKDESKPEAGNDKS